jgi:hypothetical protein
MGPCWDMGENVNWDNWEQKSWDDGRSCDKYVPYSLLSQLSIILLPLTTPNWDIRNSGFLNFGGYE